MLLVKLAAKAIEVLAYCFGCLELAKFSFAVLEFWGMYLLFSH
jgi:hypothetical protein